jgi:chemotaxis methyl-accepting protein methylase
MPINADNKNIKMNKIKYNQRSIISEISVLLHNVDILKYDETFFLKSINNRVVETKCKSDDEYFTLMQKSKKECDIFLNSLHISYSEFFRNSLTFSVLERIILPLLILKTKQSKRKEIRIWSAACAAGQEAYSLAMLLEEYNNANNEKIKYRIFATDQCKSQLTEASNGKFDTSEITHLNIKRVKQWFTKSGDNYLVKPVLKKHIDFSEFDLFNEQLTCPKASIFGDFDVVFCANLLFYYKNEFRKVILKKVNHCLSNEGYLITGESEREILINYELKEVYSQSAIFKK